jgi:hypothetical protein
LRKSAEMGGSAMYALARVAAGTGLLLRPRCLTLGVWFASQPVASSYSLGKL